MQAPSRGIVLLVHPATGDVAAIRRDDENPREQFHSLLDNGYEPVGPRCQAIATAYRAAKAEGR